MGFFAAVLASVAIVLIGNSMFGYSFAVPLVLAVSFRSSAERSFLYAFIMGLVVSLVRATPLGRESLGMLAASGLVHLYGRRFSSRHWAFTLVFAAVGSITSALVAARVLSVWLVLTDAVLAAMAIPLIGWVRKTFYPDSVTLKV